MKKLTYLILTLCVQCVTLTQPLASNIKAPKPNILFVISDDQSWLHTSFDGAPQIKTPGFDRLATQGVYFAQAFTSVASCAGSRASILTGKSFWRNKEAGLLFGRLQKEHGVFTRLLSDSGYAVGISGKSYSPVYQNFKSAYPLVKPKEGLFDKHYRTKIKVPKGIHNEDYAASFIKFVEEKPQDQPFFFWLGTKEPHRGYKKGIGAANGINPDHIKVPNFLPNTHEVRSDIADYFFEIQWADNHLVRAIDYLEKKGMLDNTLVVYTSDNGMPFPRAKATSYNYGVHMPMAMMWGNKIKPERYVTDFINSVDLAPTFLDISGANIPNNLSGKSLLPLLLSDKSGQIEPSRTYTVTGTERHGWARPNGATYGRRAIHTQDWVYIRNYNPERWPLGDPDFNDSARDISYSDAAGGPTKDYLMDNVNDPNVKPFHKLLFGKLPADELYNVKVDPAQVNNLAHKPEHQARMAKLKTQLNLRLKEDHDPRSKGLDPWQDYPFYRYNGALLKGEYLKEYQATLKPKVKKK